MDIRFLKTHTISVSSVVDQTFPKGWTGVVDDDLGLELIDDGVAEQIVDDVDGGQPDATQFTPKQAAVLRQAADQMTDQENAVQIDLDKLKVDELRAIAIEAGVEGASKMLKAELIKMLDALIEAQGTAAA